MNSKFQKRLEDRKEKGSLRSLLSFENHVDFWSNDYLGLAQIPHVFALKGSTGSRLISGNSTVVEEVEQAIATHFESDAALIFNSGYDANVGLFSSLPQKGDTIIYDELVHASVRDGIRLSFAHSFSFKHNDIEDLEKRLQKAEGTIFVAVESLYSMDGDLASLLEINRLCEEYDALLIVDEAHSGGVFGTEGKGLCEEVGIENSVFIRLFTFGKAYGAHGAVVCCSDEVRQFLINFARSFIYTTALPEGFYTHILHQIEFSKEDSLREQLRLNIAHFSQGIQSTLSSNKSPIQIVEFSELELCIQKAHQLQEAGFAVKAILPPTVPTGSQRLRICIHTFNTKEQIEKLISLLQ
ncbi:aminotransferase class I/II-fold pyridoxal phosphate-dependent enzyme [Fluviicola taffensis]|uniref:8-amino-7-oxononanoate synthase n=1 Tax=Fluviicola taffensis (strain DSM 16823 / NCIMB 13979 / RW262) TaxID=755732 RepID=F2IEK1_FLUTR|nr:8-amino-7-oxononanoate synthase [Fluviicola taffensis]AEA44540.1 8-amino-7-oxononanoate synthase [Fluviicola taffensis DSM 16823]